jgi:hypothetical protein
MCWLSCTGKYKNAWYNYQDNLKCFFWVLLIDFSGRNVGGFVIHDVRAASEAWKLSESAFLEIRQLTQDVSHQYKT